MANFKDPDSFIDPDSFVDPDKSATWAGNAASLAGPLGAGLSALTGDVGRITAQRLADAADAGITHAGTGLETLVHGGRLAPERQDEIYKAYEERKQSRQQFYNPENKELSFLQDLTSMGVSLPAQIVAMPGQAPQKMEDLINKGESAKTAAIAGLTDTALNTAALAVPAAPIAKSIGAKVLSGGAANAGFGGLSDWITSKIAETDEAKKSYDVFTERSAKNRAMEFVLGAGIGAAAPTKPKVTPKSKDAIKNLDDLVSTKEKAVEEAPIYVDQQGRASKELGSIVTDEYGDLARQQQEAKPPIYVGEDKQASLDLGSRIQEDPRIADLANAEQQRRLQEEATRKELEEQPGLFDRQQEQLDLDLQPRLTEHSAMQREPVRREGPEDHFAAEKYLSDVMDKIDIHGREQVNLANLLTTDYGKRVLRLEDNGRFDPLAVFRLIEGIKKLPEELRAAYKIVEGFLSEMDPSERPQFFVKKEADGSFATHLSEISPTTPAAYLTGQHQVKFGTQGLTARAFLHETIHGLTSRYILARGLDDPNVRELSRLFKKITKAPGFDNHYGMKNLHEFVAEAFSSPGFQDFLRRIPEATKGIANAFNKFVSLVERIFGADQGTFTNVISHAEKVLSSYAREAKQVNLEFKKLYTTSLEREIDSLTGRDLVQAIEDTKGKIKDTAGRQEDSFKKLPGMDKIDYIPDDPTLTPERKQQTLSEKDGSGVWTLTPGAIARTTLNPSTLVTSVNRLLENAIKRADIHIKEKVRPLMKDLDRVIKSDSQAEVLQHIFLKEMKENIRFTPEELSNAGVPNDIIKVYGDLRIGFDKALQAQNAIRIQKNQKPITRLEAYMASRWMGPWRATVVDSTGKKVYEIGEPSYLARQRALDYIKMKFPELSIKEIKYDGARQKRRGPLDAGYQEMLDLFGPEDPIVKKLSEVMTDLALRQTENFAGQEKHFKKKAGIGGFAGDRPWARNDTIDMFKEQVAYMENAYKWSEMQTAVEETKKWINDPEIAKAQPNNTEYAKELTKNVLGYGTLEHYRMFEDKLAQSLGINTKTLGDVLGTAKSLFYISKLGWSLPFVTISLTQPLLTTPAIHRTLTLQGFEHNPGKTLVKGLFDGVAFALKHTAAEVNGKWADRVEFTELGREAAKYAEANGVIDVTPISDIRDLGRPKAVQRAEDIGNFTTIKSEQISRAQTFMSIVHHLDQSGKFSDMKEMFQKAEELTYLAMGDYRPEQRALFFQRRGLVGNALSTLKTFVLSQLAQMAHFIKEAKGGNYSPLMIYLATMWAFAGAAGMVGIDDIDKLFENVKSILPNKQYAKIKNFGIKQFIRENFPDWVAYGPTSAFTGLNLFTRTDMGNMVPAYPFEESPSRMVESLVPFITDTAKQIQGVYKIMNPQSSHQERLEGLYSVTPTGAKGLLEEKVPGYKQGDVVFRSSNLNQGSIRRSEHDSNIRMTGFRSIGEQKRMDQNYEIKKGQSETNRRLQEVRKDIISAIVSGENLSEKLTEYRDLGGDPRTLKQFISGSMKKRAMTTLEREVAKAKGGNITSIENARRYLDTLEDVR